VFVWRTKDTRARAKFRGDTTRRERRKLFMLYVIAHTRNSFTIQCSGCARFAGKNWQKHHLPFFGQRGGRLFLQQLTFTLRNIKQSKSFPAKVGEYPPKLWTHMRGRAPPTRSHCTVSSNHHWHSFNSTATKHWPLGPPPYVKSSALLIKCPMFIFQLLTTSIPNAG